ncbi:MAG: hypothetical protein ACRBCS_15105 [Cellvibrionaceae bacterium]
MTAPTNTETPEQVNLVAAMEVLPSFDDTATDEIETVLEADIATPVTFFGKVIDESDEPLEGIPVDVVLLNRKLDPFISPYYGWTFLRDIQTDKNGYFSIKDTAAAGLSVSVSSEGFWDKGNFERHYFYASRLDKKNQFPLPTTKETAAIFTLQEKPKNAFFERISTGTIPLPNQKLTGINFEQKRYAADLDDADLLITLDKGKTNDSSTYSWSITLTSSAGEAGFQRMRGPLSFQAPSNGYQKSLTFTMDSKSQDWRDRAEWEIYVKTAKSHYALLTIRVRTRGAPFVAIDGTINRFGARYVR